MYESNVVTNPVLDVMQIELPRIKVARGTEITGQLITNIINQCRGNVARFEKLEKYYKGKHDILERTAEPGKPNNKLVNNYAKYITDITTGYFMGQPVTYNADKEEKERLKDVFDVLDSNFEEDVNYELAKDASISGIAYELVYADTEANLRFKYLDYKTVIPVYTDDIEEMLLFVIRHYTTHDFAANKKAEKAEVYTTQDVIYYEYSNGVCSEVDRQEHFFGDVPVIEYVNNEERMGDFEVVISLIDAYNKAQSDTSNDFEYFTNAYLVLVGLGGTQGQDIQQMKEDRVLLLDAAGQADWLIKEINDTALENYKSRLQKDIHRFSQTPNLTDEEFAGNLSGVALKYKLWGIEQIAAIKERKFRTGLIKRLKLITNFLNIKGGNYDYNDINLKFNRNVPQNLVEWVQMIAMLSGLLSERTQLSLLPFVDDVDAELDRKQEELKSTVEDPYNTLGKTELVVSKDETG